ncbi:hypothetical protein [Swaminathania salitolerans]|uniref:Uncharacterized protein n=1 Tax=Swaminathania salitolerans TaxID=182838 RepID=A0A511BRQ9_9PROT|nr:hypothetical protein [Swaminathania salitolerans]GBQ11542.1 hypothetical protein AA21291_0863 [Swaminathania salitolerans LMG 21291]GEL02523.1 hypothetical protein SSA02_16860 [Swaminathania salitolerans]
MANDQFDAPAFDGEDNKHHSARALAEAAFRAEEEGDREKAAQLFRQAEAADPQALESVLLERRTDREGTAPPPVASDAEVAAMTRTMEPSRHAPPPEAIDENY